MDFNPKTFRDLHREGKASLFRTGTAPDNPDAAVYAVAFPSFDPTTGRQMDDQVVGVKRADLVALRDALQAEVDELDILLAELEPLKPEEALKAKKR